MPKAAKAHKPMPRMARVHAPAAVVETYGQGRGGRPWRRKRASILVRDCYLCQPCRREGRVSLAEEVDHIVPQAEGGTEADDNLQAICTDCHKAKSKQEAARGVSRHYKG